MMKWHVLLAVVCTIMGFAVASLVMPGGGMAVNADCPGNCPGKPGTACGNGDVNADGKRDISDAVYLLSNLFLGGPEPAPLSCDLCDSCCPQAPCSGCLPATGQNQCYDDANNVIDCNDETHPGQDGSYQAGCPVEGRFVDNGDGTVKDNCTLLVWQQATADVNNDGLIDSPSDALTWAEALRYCENLVLCADGTWLSSTQIGWAPDPEDVEEHGGILWDDWRLPNVRELLSLADSGRYGPAIDPMFTIAMPGVEPWSVFYWTSTSPPNPDERGKAGDIWVWNWIVWGDAKTSRGYVLAVRG